MGPSYQDAVPVQLSPPQSARVLRYLELRQEKSTLNAEVKQVDAEMQKLKALVLADMGNNSSAIYTDVDNIYTVTYNPSRREDISKANLGGFHGNGICYRSGIQIGMFLLSGIGPGIAKAIVLKRWLLQCFRVCLRREDIGFHHTLLTVKIFHHQALRNLSSESSDRQCSGQQQGQYGVTRLNTLTV